ncbi:MAG: hypothetical protein IKV03_02020 [Alphaproteobacteria bacterium]|nr:hypothetical protein [Alphaproteobacteria bacterium]
MKISLIKALKSPFEKLFFIPCLIFIIMAILANNYHMSNVSSVKIILLLACFISSVILMGYFTIFSHNVIKKQSVLFKTTPLFLFNSSIKTFLFTLSFYLVLFCCEFFAISSLKYMPTGVGLFVFIFTQLFLFLYLLASWTRHIDEQHMFEALKIKRISNFLGENWSSYFKITLYMIITILILALPIKIIQEYISYLSKLHSWFAFPGVFISAFVYLYSPFVILHIIAQGYIGIKNKKIISEQTPFHQPMQNTNEISSIKQSKKSIKQKKSMAKKEKTTKKKA